MDIRRVSIGVKAIDRLVGGGLPEGSVIGISGPAGVGKSILALQFAVDSARKGEKSIYINLEEPRENINRTLGSLSFAVGYEDLEKKGLLSIVCLNYNEFEKVYSDLFSKIEKDNKVKRVIIDSFNCFFSYLKLERFSQTEGFEIRKILSQSFSLFRKKEFTTLLILENGSTHNSDMNHYVEYMADGIIHLDFISLGSIERRIFIPKMRWTKQYESSFSFDITSNGIVVKKEELHN